VSKYKPKPDLFAFKLQLGKILDCTKFSAGMNIRLSRQIMHKFFCAYP